MHSPIFGGRSRIIPSSVRMHTDGRWLDGIANLPSEFANCFASPLASAISTAVCNPAIVPREIFPGCVTADYYFVAQSLY